MILEFSVGNYKSFKETATLSMVAANITSKDNIDEHNVFEVNDRLSLLKSAAIYGANASGKSNLIDALRFMRWFVRTSANTEVEEPINVDRFRLSEETEDEPAFFQIVFILAGTRFRYGFELDDQQVVSEWLFHVPTTKEAKLFVRDGSDISISRKFKEGRSIQNKTKPNSLFLSVVAQFNGTIATSVVGWFRMLRVYSGGLKDMLDYQYTAGMLKSDKHREGVLELIKRLDLDIQDIRLDKRELVMPEIRQDRVSEEFRPAAEKLADALEILYDFAKDQDFDRSQAITYHTKYDLRGKQIPTPEEFDISQESDGTQKVFKLAGSLYDVLKHGKILIVDELDARLHPLITRTIIDLFNSNLTNPNNAQLIFTTHDINLLSNRIFRRDQIWFTEKDRYSATDLYSLVEFKVRNDASYERDYIRGKYGAIPFIGNLEQLLGEPDAQ